MYPNKKSEIYQVTLDLRRPPNICCISVVSCKLGSTCFSPPSPSKQAACIDITRCLVVFKLRHSVNKWTCMFKRERQLRKKKLKLLWLYFSPLNRLLKCHNTTSMRTHEKNNSVKSFWMFIGYQYIAIPSIAIQRSITH